MTLPDGGPTDELEEIVWLPLADAQGADLPAITGPSSARSRSGSPMTRCSSPAARCPSSGWSATVSSVTFSRRHRNGSTQRRCQGTIRVPRRPARWQVAIAAAIASISVVGIAIGLGMPLLSVVLEARGHSASMIGLNTAVAGLASIAAAPLATPLAAAVRGRLDDACDDRRWRACPCSASISRHRSGCGFRCASCCTRRSPSCSSCRNSGSASLPRRERRGFVLGIYATVLSLGFALGPWLFAQTGQPWLPAVRRRPSRSSWWRSCRCWRPGRKARSFRRHGDDAGSFLRFIWLVPTATAAVLVFGAVETGGFALFPRLWPRASAIPKRDAALLLTMIGLGNVILQIPLGMLSDRVGDRRVPALACAAGWARGTLLMP